MIYLFSILYLSWALWRRDISLYEFDFDIRISAKTRYKFVPYPYYRRDSYGRVVSKNVIEAV